MKFKTIIFAYVRVGVYIFVFIMFITKQYFIMSSFVFVYLHVYLDRIFSKGNEKAKTLMLIAHCRSTLN